MKLVAGIGILLFAISTYSWYWLYSRGAFGTSPVSIPVQLEAGTRTAVRFLVRETGNHQIRIDYPTVVSSRLRKDLDELSGKAVLTSKSDVVEAKLPSNHQTWYGDTAGMVIFTVPTKPKTEYVLSLNPDRIPPALANSQATVRVALDPNYYLLFPQMHLLSTLLLVLALFCLLPGIRRQAPHLKRLFLVLLMASGGMVILGSTGFVLFHSNPISNWNRWIMNISFALLGIGPIAFVASVAFWFVASLITWLGSHARRG